MDRPLIIFGSGGHAKVMIEAVRARDPSREIFLVDDNPDTAARTVLGLRISGNRDWLSSNQPDSPVALGIGDNYARLEVLEWLLAQERDVETIIHPAATVGSSVEVGAGAFFSAGSIAIAEATIGRAAIVNTGASVDHDCVLGDAVHIGPGVKLCGNVRVGARSLIGVGTSAKPGVVIAADVVVGAGSAVVSDLIEAGTYCGCPARPLDR